MDIYNINKDPLCQQQTKQNKNWRFMLLLDKYYAVMSCSVPSMLQTEVNYHFMMTILSVKQTVWTMYEIFVCKPFFLERAIIMLIKSEINKLKTEKNKLIESVHSSPPNTWYLQNKSSKNPVKFGTICSFALLLWMPEVVVPHYAHCLYFPTSWILLLKSISFSKSRSSSTIDRFLPCSMLLFKIYMSRGKRLNRGWSWYAKRYGLDYLQCMRR